MNKLTSALLLGVLLLLGRCAATTAPPTAVPRGEDRFLIDPRTGAPPAASPDADRHVSAAWRFFLAGDYTRARRELAESRSPDLAPVALIEALVQFREGNLNTAEAAVNRVLQRHPDYTAASIAAAEIAIAQNDSRRAVTLYRSLQGRGGIPPTVAERIALLEGRLFDELVTTSRTASDADAIRFLSEALTINPGATEPRMMLVTRLVALRRFDEARRYLEPVLATDVDRPDVQEALAEIDAGRGRYQEAIVRYERLQRRAPDPRYQRRLEDIKEAWSLANMPLHFQTALESPAITRGDFAVLLYWRVTAVRFAQNLATPPIAIDIDVPGREEIIRAIAIGLYDVDPVTRRVGPQRLVTTASLSRLAGRVLLLRGASCARGTTPDRVLESCGITDPLTVSPADAQVSGREAVRVLDQIEQALSRP